MHSMKSQAKSSAAAKKSSIMGTSPVARSASKYATNDSDQTGETQKYPTRAMGGIVTAQSGMEGRAGGGRLDRPPRVGVSIGATGVPPAAPGLPAPAITGAPMAVPGTIPGTGGPMMGPAGEMPGISGMPERVMMKDRNDVRDFGVGGLPGAAEHANTGGRISRAMGGMVTKPPMTPKGGAGGGLGRMQDAAAQKKADKKAPPFK